MTKEEMIPYHMEEEKEEEEEEEKKSKNKRNNRECVNYLFILNRK